MVVAKYFSVPSTVLLGTLGATLVQIMLTCAMSVTSHIEGVNKLDTTYNNPLWFGPWVSSIEVNVSQDAGTGVNLAKYKWPSPENMVVHAMA